MRPDQVLAIAADLLRDGSDPEYRRGIVNLIAEMWPVKGQPTDERMTYVDSMIDRVIEASL